MTKTFLLVEESASGEKPTLLAFRKAAPFELDPQ